MMCTPCDTTPAPSTPENVVLTPVELPSKGNSCHRVQQRHAWQSMLSPHEMACPLQGGSSLPWILALGGAGAGLYFAKEQGYFDSFLGGSGTPVGRQHQGQREPRSAALACVIDRWSIMI